MFKKKNLPFRISKLVTLLSDYLGDFWKNLGVRFGGNVRGLRAPELSHDTGWSEAILDDVVILSKCSVEAGLLQLRKKSRLKYSVDKYSC